MRFKLFTEKSDIFGFSDIDDKEEQELTPKDDDLPIQPFNVQWMMDVLSRKKIHGRIKSTDAFLDHVIWGESKSPGTIRVRLTPNILVCIERCIKDLEGATTWVLKKVFKPRLREFAGKEEIVAKEVFEEVQELYPKKLDAASEDYKNLLHLSKRLTDSVRFSAPLIYDYQDIKEKTKDYYVAYFSIRNAGVGKLISKSRRHTLSPELTIDINYNKERGLIHIILGTVSMGGEGEGMSPDLPLLDSWYASTQNKDEIIDTIITTLKFY